MSDYREREVRLAVFDLLEELPTGLATTDLIRLLQERMAPSGPDAAILANRHDTHFSQKVRNITAGQRTTVRRGLLAYNGLGRPVQLTPAGRAYLAQARVDGRTTEAEYRQRQWNALLARAGPSAVAPAVLHELRIYRGAQGLWTDAERTRQYGPERRPITVALLHTGSRHEEDLSAEGVIYHYPRNARGARDAAGINATKRASRLEMPVFVVSHAADGRLRDVRRAWIAGWDDEREVFDVIFGDSPSSDTLTHLARSLQEHPTPASDWTDAEVQVAVALYFEMLRGHLGGEPLVKRALVTAALLDLPGRTLGAVEFKLENISAVLRGLGLEWLDGYAPAPNYQRRLEDAVLNVLTADPTLVGRLSPIEEAIPPLPPAQQSTDDVRVPPPAAGRERRAGGRGGHRLGRGDWAAHRDEANRRLGKAGELWVVSLEQEKLRRAGRPDLADRVDHVAERLGDGLGYDVASFEVDGRELHIEVKTTRSGVGTPFALTPNEIVASADEADRFRLYRVFGFGSDPRLYVLEGALELLVDLTPTLFAAVPKSPQQGEAGPTP